MSKNPCGEFPIRQDITVLSGDVGYEEAELHNEFLEKIKDRMHCDVQELKSLRLGWKIYETVGACMINPHALKLINLSPENDYYQDFLDRIQDRLG